MSTITKERVAGIASGEKCYTHDDVVELARIALASLEAEPVGCDACGGNGSVDIDHGEMGIEHIECPKCYPAPPAPVSVPECFKRLLHHAYGMTMGHDWNKGTMAGHHRTKLCQAVEECRAAMLQGADGNSPVIPDWQAKAEKMAELHGSSFVVFRNGESPQCADPSKVIISFTDEGLGHGAAAPQQEA